MLVTKLTAEDKVHFRDKRSNQDLGFVQILTVEYPQFKVLLGLEMPSHIEISPPQKDSGNEKKKHS